MTVVLTGAALTVEQVVAVARDRAAASFDAASLERMAAGRAVVDRALARGDDVYGLTTGVGAAVRRRAAPDDRALIRSHLVGQGPNLPDDVVRAAALAMLNAFATGAAGVRSELAMHVLDALNGGSLPSIRTLGSVGQADLAPLAELAEGVLGSFDLAGGEGLALISSNAFSTGASALVAWDARRLLDVMDVSAALSMEGFAANPAPLDAAATRQHPGVSAAAERMRTLLEGSGLWEPGGPRNLHDPLTFRNIAVTNGSARDAIGVVLDRLRVELNTPQCNPAVILDEDRIVPTANFDALPLAWALDAFRVALASAVSSVSERIVKLLDSSWSGLPRGLVDDAVDGLSYLGITAQGLAAEARLLAAPVSFELSSTAHAEGIEDRTTMAPLGVRRTAEMFDLAKRLVATELTVAAQAVDARACRLGDRMQEAHGLVRARIPMMVANDQAPPQPESLLELISSGELPVSLTASAAEAESSTAFHVQGDTTGEEP